MRQFEFSTRDSNRVRPGSLALLALLLLIGLITIGLLQPQVANVTQASTAHSPALTDGEVTLTLLHNNDGESGLLPTTSSVDDQDIEVGGAAAFKSVADREVADATDAGNAVVMVYAGDAFLASATLQCSLPIDSDNPVYDAIAQRQMPYTAHILGNHEFDYSPDFLERFIRAFEVNGELTQPFLSTNLDFSGEPGLADLLDPDGLIVGTPTDGEVLAGSLIYTDPTTGAEFGIVGATTPALASVSSPRDVTVVEDTVAAVQTAIDRLQEQGVDKIIFVSHLQDVENDQELIQQLEGVDLAVAGGGDDFLVNPNVDQDIQLLPGQDAGEIEGDYPLEVTDAVGRTVYIVTSIDKYRFLGRLDVQFDAEGEVETIVTEESYPRRVVNASDVADSLGIEDAVAPNQQIVTTVNEPVQTCLDELQATTIANTEILLNASRDAVRGGESNLGNLVSDAFIDSYQRYADDSGLEPIDPDNPVVALQNGGGIRQNAGDVLPRDGTVPGPITQLDTIDVLPFSNFISVVQDVSPAELLAILDNRSTSGIYQVANLELEYNTVTEDGETQYVIDSITLITSDNNRVPLVEAGEVVAGAPDVSVVTNSFVAGREFADNPNQTSLVDENGARILYEQPLREYLQTFPEEDGVPTIPADDPRYQSGGEGRIVINPADPGDGEVTLTLLHNNDGESSLLPLENPVPPDAGYTNTTTETLEVGGVAAFSTLFEQQVDAAEADGNAVVSVYAGDAFLASATLQCSLDDPDGPVYDAVAQRQMPYDAHILGNHEFDFSPDFLERFIRDFAVEGELTQPFLSANLDFSGEPGFADLVDADGLIEIPVTDGRVIGFSAIKTDATTGEQFGIIGATTPQLPNISSPRNVTVTTEDIAATAAAVQAEIDRLQEQGVAKIILVSHLQNLDNDQELIQQTNGVDLAVAGGGDELLVNPNVPQEQQLLPGEQAPIGGDYPLEVTDAAGRTVYIVTTAGNYKYLGRLDATFDADGEVLEVVTDASYPRPVIPAGETAEDLGVTNTVAPDPALVSSVIAPVEACLADLAEPIVGSEVLLDVSRSGVRGQETNAGNLVADSYRYAYEQLADENDLPALDEAGPVIAIQNGGGIRQNAGDILPTSGDVPGTISRLDTKNVLAFFNLMTVVQEVTPEELKQIFERSVSRIGGGQFLQIAGLQVSYNPDLTAQEIAEDGTVTTPGERVISITLADGTPIVQDGQVVPDAPNVTIITNGFTAAGGDNYPWLANNPNKTQLFDEEGVALTYEQAWVNYLRSFPEQKLDLELLPTIPDDDPRYQPGGEGRITTTDETPTTPPPADDPLNFQCQPQTLDIAGTGMLGLSEQSLTIPGMGEALIQLGGRGGTRPEPESVVFTFADDTTVTQTAPELLLGSTSGTPRLAYAFQTSGPVGEVTASVTEATDRNTTRALLAYHTLPAAARYTGVTATTLQFAYYGLADWTTAELMLALPEPLTTMTDLTVKVAVMDIDDDDRFVLLSAEAGGTMVTQVVHKPNRGERANVETLVLTNVPAGTETVTVRLTSPFVETGMIRGEGDSAYLLGATVVHPCQEPDPYPAPEAYPAP